MVVVVGGAVFRGSGGRGVARCLLWFIQGFFFFFLEHATWEAQWTDPGFATLPSVSRGAALRRTVTPAAREIRPLLLLDSLNRLFKKQQYHDPVSPLSV